MMKKFFCFFMVLFLPTQLSCALSSSSFAADRNIELHDQRLRSLEEQQRRQMLLSPPQEHDVSPQLPAPTDSGPCTQISKVTVAGVTVAPMRKIRAITQSREGQCLTLGGINALLQEITDVYIQEGYISSRAVLEPQDLSLGILRVRIIEGRVEGIEVSPGSSMNPRQLKTVFPFVKDSVLQLRDIEQGLDQLNRLPSNRATMHIAPGSALGNSKVVIDNIQQRTWRPSVGFDNLGQDSTGRAEYTLGLEKDNFIGCNDQVSFYYTSAAPQISGQFKNNREGFSESATGLFSVPFGYWLLSGSASRFNYTTQIHGLNQTYTSNGNTSALRMALDRVVWRDGNSKLSAGTFIQYRDVENRFEDELLVASSYRLTTTGLTASYVRRMLGGVLVLQAEQIWGLPGMSRSVPGPVTSTTPHAQFSKTTGTLDWQRPFVIGLQQWAWHTTAYGQTSEQTLYGSERLYVGSPYTVRGYRDTPTGGDCGGYIRNELVWTVPEKLTAPVKKAELGPVRLFAAYDYGGISRDSKDPHEWGELTGLTAGLRTSGNLAVQASWSTPLTSPDYVKNKADVWSLTLKYTF